MFRPMRKLYRFPSFLLALALALAAPVGTILSDELTEEVIAGSSIPIPPDMAPSTDHGTELMVPGFMGGQMVYQGHVKPREVIRFYQKNMPLRSWEPYASLVSGGGLLVFIQTNKSVLIMVSESKGITTLAILVGVVPHGT